MKEYTYKCVQVPSTINVGRAGQSQAVSEYERIINEAAVGGWVLSNIDSVSTHQQTGCLGGLFGQTPIVTTYKLLVFKKEIPTSCT